MRRRAPGSLVASAVNQDGGQALSPRPTAPPSSAPSAAPCARRAWTRVRWMGLRCTAQGHRWEIRSRAPRTPCWWSPTRRRAALTMSAMKSGMGAHGSAAGAAVSAVLGVGALSARGIVHLKAINPHLASLTRNATSRAVDAMALPRQHLAAGAAAGAGQAPRRQRQLVCFPGHQRPRHRGGGERVDVAGARRADARRRGTASGSGSAAATLLQAAVVDTSAGIMRFEARISVDHQAYLLITESVGEASSPAAAFLEVGSTASHGTRHDHRAVRHSYPRRLYCRVAPSAPRSCAP